MKNLILLLVLSIALVSFANPVSENSNNSPDITVSSDYCNGWSDGYCEGYKDVKGQYAICPVAPTCPIANPGQTRYKDGYNRGFKAGTGAAKK